MVKHKILGTVGAYLLRANVRGAPGVVWWGPWWWWWWWCVCVCGGGGGGGGAITGFGLSPKNTIFFTPSLKGYQRFCAIYAIYHKLSEYVWL